MRSSEIPSASTRAGDLWMVLRVSLTGASLDQMSSLGKEGACERFLSPHGRHCITCSQGVHNSGCSSISRQRTQCKNYVVNPSHHDPELQHMIDSLHDASYISIGPDRIPYPHAPGLTRVS